MPIVLDNVAAPFVIDRPKRKLTDAADDLVINLERLGTYAVELLVAAHFFEQSRPTVVNLQPELHAWFEEKHLIQPGPVPAPRVTLAHESWEDMRRELTKSIYHTVITQLVTRYEIFLRMLAEEIYLYNHELLAKPDRQVTSEELLRLGSYDAIVRQLIRRAVRTLVALSYPELVKRFASEFQVGLHHKTSPASLFEIHHLHEIRNVIVHAGGYVSVEYVERMSAYSDDNVLELHQALPIDFVRFFQTLELIGSLALFADAMVQAKWQTSADA